MTEDTVLQEAVQHVEHLVEHGRSMKDGLDHAFHRYGTDRAVVAAEIRRKMTDTGVQRVLRARLDS